MVLQLLQLIITFTIKARKILVEKIGTFFVLLVHEFSFLL